MKPLLLTLRALPVCKPLLEPQLDMGSSLNKLNRKALKDC